MYMARNTDTFATRLAFHSVDLLRASLSHATVCVFFLGKACVFQCLVRTGFFGTHDFANT